MPSVDMLLFVLTLVAALGCALVAGIFLAFSNFVMKALARIALASGIAAMQSINVVVLNPGFLGLFLGTALVCVALLFFAVSRWQTPGTLWLAAGSLCYLVGTLVVTMVFNVPRNNTLARVDPSKSEAATMWRVYVAGWTMWNHVRTIAALMAAVLLVFALSHQVNA